MSHQKVYKLLGEPQDQVNKFSTYDQVRRLFFSPTHPFVHLWVPSPIPCPRSPAPVSQRRTFFECQIIHPVRCMLRPLLYVKILIHIPSWFHVSFVTNQDGHNPVKMFLPSFWTLPKTFNASRSGSSDNTHPSSSLAYKVYLPCHAYFYTSWLCRAIRAVNSYFSCPFISLLLLRPRSRNSGTDRVTPETWREGPVKSMLLPIPRWSMGKV